jgi:hypothetical protein
VALVVDPYTATPGAVIAAAEINARISAILAQVNGNLDAANVKDGSVTKVKLGSDSLQAFLQLGVPATKKLRFGSVAPGAWGSVAQRDDTIAHSLAAVPDLAGGIWLPGIATVSSGGTVLPVVVSLFSKDGTNIVLRSRTADGATTNNAATLLWWAVG